MGMIPYRTGFVNGEVASCPKRRLNFPLNSHQNYGILKAVNFFGGTPMKISTKGRYALRLMVDIAQHVDDGPVSLRDAARRQQLSDKYLEQIVTPLARAGLVRSVRGAGGGYLLTRKPEAYSVGHHRQMKGKRFVHLARSSVPLLSFENDTGRRRCIRPKPIGA